MWKDTLRRAKDVHLQWVRSRCRWRLNICRFDGFELHHGSVELGFANVFETRIADEWKCSGVVELVVPQGRIGECLLLREGNFGFIGKGNLAIRPEVIL